MRNYLIFPVVLTICGTFFYSGLIFERTKPHDCRISAHAVMEYLYLEDKAFEIAVKCSNFTTNCDSAAEKALHNAEVALLELKRSLAGCYHTVTTDKQARFLLNSKGVES